MQNKRHDGRAFNEIRQLDIVPNFISSADGSCLISCGRTRVICTASVEERVPAFLDNAGLGWLTAEYGMLPASTSSRMGREKVLNTGRSHEIQRLIGRSLRACLDRKALGQRTITIDCDVIEAHGGTRTAAINGGYVALSLAVQKMLKQGLIKKSPIVKEIAAISLGMVAKELLLDLDFVEDSSADVDANLVATGEGEVVEWQLTSERLLLPRERISEMLELGFVGIEACLEVQRRTLAACN